MKKLLAIVVLGLMLTSCAANSYLEYRYKTGGQLSSHSVSGWTDEEMVIKASQECMKFNKNARAKNVIKRYEGGLGKILGEGGIAILKKVFGIILLAIAVKLFTSNIPGLFNGV